MNHIYTTVSYNLLHDLTMCHARVFRTVLKMCNSKMWQNRERDWNSSTTRFLLICKIYIIIYYVCARKQIDPELFSIVF